METKQTQTAEELQAQLTRQEEIENKRYENTAAQLQQQFDGSREEWVRKLVTHCLDAD